MGNKSTSNSNNNRQSSISAIERIKHYPNKSIEEQFLKYKSSSFSSVSIPLLMKRKIGEYHNQTIITTLQTFEASYPLYREVLGDGNCFYRSVFFLYIEGLIDMHEQGHSVDERIEQMLSVDSELSIIAFVDSIPNAYKRFLPAIGGIFFYGMCHINIEIIQSTSLSKQKKLENLQKLLDSYPIFDFSIILMLRTLALKALSQFAPQLSEFYLGSEETLIRDFSTEAQNCIVKLICEYLSVDIIIENVGREGINQNVFNPEFNFIQDQFNYTLCLFFRPGHYDICYTSAYANSVYQKQTPNNNNNNNNNNKSNIQKNPRSESFQSNQSSIIIEKSQTQEQSQLSAIEVRNDDDNGFVIVEKPNQQETKQQQQTMNVLFKECCFFCNQSIPISINEMRICVTCYNQKLGSITLNCKICSKELLKESRNYCLCKECESSHFMYQNLSQASTAEGSNSSGLPILAADTHFRSTLLNHNEEGVHRFSQNLNNHTLFEFIPGEQQTNENTVRCVLCFNSLLEFKSFGCKSHIVCNKCVSDSSNKSLQQLCYCHKKIIY